jgi:preprotein translocase subunit SecB
VSAEWDQSRIQRYIDDEIEESLNLEYKGADALGKSDGKKREITRDVSSMANSAGGIILYGVKEFDERERRHNPESIDSINRLQFSKEWLAQVINNISPRIVGLDVQPVDLDTGPSDVVYVVKIPQSNTAHQATDLKYYRRYGIERLAMYDHEIREVMNRSKIPDAKVRFDFELKRRDQSFHEYLLKVTVENVCDQVINHFKLEFSFPGIFRIDRTINIIRMRPNISAITNEQADHLIVYHSNGVLFPREELDISDEVVLLYRWNDEIREQVMRALTRRGVEISINWTLYADNMPAKRGSKPIMQLSSF